STEMAAAQAVRETRRYPIEAPGGHRELLSNQGPHGCSRSREWEHPDAHQSRARLQESALPPAQGQATVGQQPRTPRRAPNHESHVICSLCQILAQRGFFELIRINYVASPDSALFTSPSQLSRYHHPRK